MCIKFLHHFMILAFLSDERHDDNITLHSSLYFKRIMIDYVLLPVMADNTSSCSSKWQQTFCTGPLILTSAINLVNAIQLCVEWSLNKLYVNTSAPHETFLIRFLWIHLTRIALTFLHTYQRIKERKVKTLCRDVSAIWLKLVIYKDFCFNCFRWISVKHIAICWIEVLTSISIIISNCRTFAPHNADLVPFIHFSEKYRWDKCWLTVSLSFMCFVFPFFSFKFLSVVTTVRSEWFLAKTFVSISISSIFLDFFFGKMLSIDIDINPCNLYN